MKLVPVADKRKLEEAGIFFRATTLRKWHSLGVHAQIFVKLNNRLFIIQEKWEDLIAQRSKESEKRAKRLEEIKCLK